MAYDEHARIREKFGKLDEIIARKGRSLNSPWKSKDGDIRLVWIRLTAHPNLNDLQKWAAQDNMNPRARKLSDKALVDCKENAKFSDKYREMIKWIQSQPNYRSTASIMSIIDGIGDYLKAHGHKDFGYGDIEKIALDMRDRGDIYIIEGGGSDWTFFKGER